MFLSIFRKKPKSNNLDELKSMPKSDKKEFLSNDLIARMIRLEQRVSASFGEIVPFNKTKYYRGLTDLEKKKFNKYLHSKLGSKFVFSILLLLSIFGVILSTGSINGNVIGAGDSVSFGGLILLGITVIGFIIFLFYHMHKKRREKMFKSVLDLFDGSIKKKSR